MGIWAEIKHALNSTLGTSSFTSLDKLLGTKIETVDTNVKGLRGGYNRSQAVELLPFPTA